MFRTLVTRQISRNFSVSSHKHNLVEVSVDSKSGHALVSLNRPKVNAMNAEILKAVATTLDELAVDKTRGIILTSTSEKVFCAGLDLTVCSDPDETYFKQLWTNLQDVWLKLYGFPYPVVAAINGHCIAGGCVYALASEYRVMVDNYRIGLNETEVGLVCPGFLQEAMRDVIGDRRAEEALTMGSIFSARRAQEIGLVDEVAKDKEEAIERCAAWLDLYKDMRPQARTVTKLRWRKRILDDLVKNREQDWEDFWRNLTGEEPQNHLKRYLGALKAKSV